MIFKTIGDALTDAEFNALIYLLLKHKQLSENIKITTSSFYSEYDGIYEFIFEDVAVVDNGLVISQNTLNSENNVIFEDGTLELGASRILHYDVLRVNGFSFDDENEEDINILHYSLPLQINEPTLFDFSELEENDILLFDAKVDLKFDNKIIEEL